MKFKFTIEAPLDVFTYFELIFFERIELIKKSLKLPFQARFFALKLFKQVNKVVKNKRQ